MSNYSEIQLIERCKKGETAAFEPLINNYRRQLYTYLWKMCRDKMTAEDLFQETSLKVWCGMKGYSELNRFSSWLFSIAHNVAMDNHRKNRIRNSIVNSDEINDLPDNVTHLNEIFAAELKTIINSAVDKLPAKQKRVFLLRQHGNMKFKEIADITGEPLNTVLAHMNYAVRKIKNVIEVRDAI